MKFGFTLPMRAYEPDELVDWATRIEAGPFESVNVGERIVWSNHDALTSLSFLAAVTSRVRLMTGVMVLPIHREVLLAKQVASLDRLSKGRVVLGLGVGDREPDFIAAGVPFDSSRGALFEQQLETMRRVWRGEAAVDGLGEVGPPPVQTGGPEIVIGGFSNAALRRTGRVADGLRSFDYRPDPDLHLERAAIARRAWVEAGRPGALKLYASTFFALGPNAREVYEASLRPYYAYAGEEGMQWAMSDTVMVTPKAVREAVTRFEDAGIDEMGFAVAYELGPESVDRLADAIAGAG